MWKINYAVDEMKSIFLIWIFKLIISSIQMLIFHWRDRGLIDGEGPWKIAFFFFWLVEVRAQHKSKIVKITRNASTETFPVSFESGIIVSTS